MPALVSVIIPTFNRAHLLEQAIHSVINQTVGDFEIVVVDDGSSDGTRDMVKRFGDRVRFFRQEHGGLNVARNLGLSKAQGEYIALLDDDDLWLPFKTEVQLAVINRFPEIAYVFSDFTIFSENGSSVPNGLSTWHKNSLSWDKILPQSHSGIELGLPVSSTGTDCRVYVGNLYRELLHRPYINPCTALIRRAKIPQGFIFPPDNTHCGDWAFFAVLSRYNPCAFLDMETSLNRSHDDPVRLTRKSPRVQVYDRLKMIDEVWKSDPAFMETHKHEVYQVEAQQLVKMSKYCLLDGEARRGEAVPHKMAVTAHSKERDSSLATPYFFLVAGKRTVSEIGAPSEAARFTLWLIE